MMSPDLINLLCTYISHLAGIAARCPFLFRVMLGNFFDRTAASLVLLESSDNSDLGSAHGLKLPDTRQDQLIKR